MPTTVDELITRIEDAVGDEDALGALYDEIEKLTPEDDVPEADRDSMLARIMRYAQDSHDAAEASL